MLNEWRPRTGLKPGHYILSLRYFVFVFRHTGPIPEELGKLTALKELHLDRNNLSGEISNSLEATCMHPAWAYASTHAVGPIF